MSTNGRASILGGDWLPAQWVYEGGRIRTAEKRSVMVVAATWVHEGEHIVRHDPHAELRRCAADRRIVEYYRDAHDDLARHQTLEYEPSIEGHAEARGFAEGAADILRILAEGYGIGASDG